ncbi:MAG: regulatory protein RecX [Bacillota bacterium]|nr:regulatory protein RecX [Bacillota bacterium]
MEWEEAYRYAVRLLAIRARSSEELQERLQRKGCGAEMAAEVVERLRAQGYVDDVAFARQWVEERCSARPSGVKRLWSELSRLGVPREVIASAVEEVLADPEGELALARRAVEQRWRRYQGLAPEERSRRVAGFLLRRGFTWETVEALLKELNPDEPESPVSTHEKILPKGNRSLT